jgi:hypothetical protein
MAANDPEQKPKNSIEPIGFVDESPIPMPALWALQFRFSFGAYVAYAPDHGGRR